MSILYANNESYEFKIGSSLLDIIQSNGLGMESPCGGKGLCGKCKIQVLDGDINELSEEELKFLSKEEVESNIRLGCLVYPKGDLKVKFLNDKNKNHKILVDGYMPEFKKHTLLNKVIYDLKRPTLKSNSSYEDIITETINYDLNSNYTILKEIPNLFEKDKFTGVYLESELIGLEEGDTSDNLYSIAVDIGTTTVVCSLIDIKNQI
ncbi:MAG: 2Fe-2S iron-sulfur cluster-binding protein, partial [Paraclostridium sp.]